jgi:hypothetical protein
MADLLKVMEREMLHSEHAARCVLEARRRDVRKGGKMTKKAPGPSPWGRDDIMAVAAVRYCLGRMTYITSDCADWMIEQWANIKPSAQKVIQQDIYDAFRADDTARQQGGQYKPLGWDCDRKEWERVRALWLSKR